MLRFALARLVSLVLTVLAASVAIFVVIEVVPGDPATMMLGINARPDTLVALRTELGLDGNPPERYLRWIAGVLRGDFGVSYTYRTPVAGLIADRLWVSLPLAFYALALSVFVAFPVGIAAASRRGSARDTAIMGVTQVGIAVPNFWVAMLLVLLFAVTLRFAYVITRIALAVSMGMALPIVMLDVLLSLTLWSAFERAF